jgi:outer membrane protein assembly factor BamE
MISPYFSLACIRPVVARAARVAAAAGVVLLGACGTANNVSNQLAGIITPYKIDVVQGNFVSKEQAAALQPGMTRVQVRDLLGTPLLTSIFHADRWDYVFTFKRQRQEPQSRRVTVHFKDDLLTRFEAGDLPTEAEFVASLDSGRRIGKVKELEASEDSLAKFAASRASTAPANSAGGAGADAATKVLPPLPERYPPLEPSVR